MALSILTIGSSQLILSTQSQEFVALQEHTTHLTEKYERISADYEELCQVVMDTRSQMSGTCVPFFFFAL